MEKSASPASLAGREPVLPNRSSGASIRRGRYTTCGRSHAEKVATRVALSRQLRQATCRVASSTMDAQMNGLEVQARRPGETRRRRGYFITGRDDPAVRETPALNAGAIAFLIKTFRKTRLLCSSFEKLPHPESCPPVFGCCCRLGYGFLQGRLAAVVR